MFLYELLLIEIPVIDARWASMILNGNIIEPFFRRGDVEVRSHKAATPLAKPPTIKLEKLIMVYTFL